MKKEYTIKLSVLFLAFLLFASAVSLPRGLAAENQEIEFPDVTGYFEGNVTIPTLTLVELAEHSEQFLRSLKSLDIYDTRGTPGDLLREMPVGYSWGPGIDGIGDIVKISEKAFAVTFYEQLEAPVLDATTTTENVNEFPVEPSNEEEGTGDWSIFDILSDQSNLIKNETAKNYGSTAVEFTDDFQPSTYKYLLLYKVMSSGSNNISVVVSYSNSSSPTNLNSTYAVNVTVYNEYVRDSSTLWWRLDKENTANTYVNHIKITGINVIGGIYVFSLTQDLSDPRYDTVYFEDRTTSVSVHAIEKTGVMKGWEKIRLMDLPADERTKLNSLPPGSEGGLKANGLWSSLKAKDFLKVPSPIKNTYDNLKKEARGWDSATDLSNSIKASVAAKLGVSANDMGNLKLSKAIMGWSVPKLTATTINNAMEKAADIRSDAKGVLEDAKKTGYKVVNFATSVKAEVVGKVSDVAKDAKEATNGIYGAIKNAGSSVAKFAVDVKDKIVDSVGNIKEGAISIVGKAKEALSGFGNSMILLIFGGLLVMVIVLALLNKYGVIG